MVVCVVNSRICLWCIYGVCIEDGDCGLGCVLKGVESKVEEDLFACRWS